MEHRVGAVARGVGMAVQELWGALVGLGAPSCCGCCGEWVPRGPFCEACEDTLTWAAEGCPRCGQDAPGVGRGPCRSCLRQPPAFDGCRALLVHGGPIVPALTAIKHHGDLDLLRRLSAWWADEIRWRLHPADVIVPVPLHARRVRDRGFNQAALLADALAEAGLARVSVAMTRLRDTGQQVGRTRAERMRSLGGAFRVDRLADVAGARVVLVDDVVTTGATVRECARALRAAGALRVEVACVARAGGAAQDGAARRGDCGRRARVVS